MSFTQNFKNSYFKQKDQIVHKVSQSVTKFTKHSFRDGVVGGGWVVKTNFSV